MITLTEQEKMSYKRAEIDRAAWIGKQYLYLKGYETDGKNSYVIVDIDPESDDVNTVIVRRLYNNDEYFIYKGIHVYMWDTSRVL